MVQWGCPPDLLDNVQVVVSELVTNAVLHGGGALSVALTLLADAVRVEVGDRSGLLPAESGYGRGATTGRGLALVASMSRDWDFEPQESGKLVWAEVSLGSVTIEAAARPPPRMAAVVADGVPIVWKRVPVGIYQALQEQNDAVQREVDLLLIGLSDGIDSPVPDTLLQLCLDLRERFGRPTSAYRSVVAAAASRGDELVDLEMRMPAGSTDVGLALVELFEQIEAFAAGGHLLVHEPTAEVRRLRRWFVDELLIQMGGGGASPYA